MSVDIEHGVSKTVVDLYGNPFYTALAQAVETLRHAPYWHEGEKAPSRLDRARELVRNSRVLLQDARLATVYGSTKLYDVTGFHCTCPQSQKGQSSWCVHAVSVKLARTLAEQGPREAAPVALGTLRPGTLPLGPTSVDERLALSTIHDNTALSTHHTPQEDRMSDDTYIPEPDDAQVSTAVLEPPDTTAATPRPLPGPVLLPSLDARSLEASMQAWAEQRQVVRRFIQTQLVDGTDYYTLQMGQRSSKPTLSKAGSEKFLGLFQLHAIFAQDTATWTMLGEPKGTLCYVCHLLTRSGEVVSEGRGARDVLKEKDINKAIKMAQKSAQIDAVLRTGALSEAFTQDVNDEDDEPAKPGTPARPTSQDLRKRIWAMVQAQAPHVTTREAIEAWVHKETGYTLHADHFDDIVEALEVRA